MMTFFAFLYKNNKYLSYSNDVITQDMKEVGVKDRDNLNNNIPIRHISIEKICCRHGMKVLISSEKNMRRSPVRLLLIPIAEIKKYRAKS